MTNINCSEKCIYQKDGICTLENTTLKTLTPTKQCAYFSDTID